jgi:hypothetical protein
MSFEAETKIPLSMPVRPLRRIVLPRTMPLPLTS